MCVCVCVCVCVCGCVCASPHPPQPLFLFLPLSLSLALFARVCVYEQVADQLVTPQDDGFFTIGVLGGKTESNVGTLWRSAFQLDAKVWGE